MSTIADEVPIPSPGTHVLGRNALTKLQLQSDGNKRDCKQIARYGLVRHMKDFNLVRHDIPLTFQAYNTLTMALGTLLLFSRLVHGGVVLLISGAYSML